MTLRPDAKHEEPETGRTTPHAASGWTFFKRGAVGRLARSAAVGVLATLCDLAALHLLVRWAGLPPVLANVPALALGVAVQFFGNKHFAFRDPSRHDAAKSPKGDDAAKSPKGDDAAKSPKGDLVRQGTRFAAVEVGAFGLNAIGFHALVALVALPYAVARLVASAVVYFGFSFPMWGLVFRPRVEEGA